MKRSLHIGVDVTDRNAYPVPFDRLSACVNDATAMEQVAAAAGFEHAHLHDADATAHAVLDALGGLARRSAVGDLTFVTYSGHGSQADDQNRDEDDDAADETLVLHDRQIFDDELWVAWSKFPPGARILFLADSCHSGSVARVSALLVQKVAAEADREPLGSARTRRMPRAARDRDFELRAMLYRSIRDALPAPDTITVSATVVLFAACQDGEEAFERDGHGLMTKAFLDTWDGGSFRGGYFDLFQALAARVKGQTPNYLVLGHEDQLFEQEQALG